MFETKKIIKYNQNARRTLLEGVEKLTKAVAVTMGPKGETVVIEKQNQALPTITKDGVSVARAVNLKDQFQNMGAQIVKEAASRTAEEAGDGTTTATVMTYAIFKEGVKMIEAGFSQVDLTKGLNQAKSIAIDHLKSISKPVKSGRDLEQIGTISANGEEVIGKLIAQAMKEVGPDGVVSVEEAKSFDTTLDVVEGAEYNTGYMSPYFVNNMQKMCVEFENPRVLVTDQELSNLKAILPLLEQACNNSTPLIIVAPKITEEVLQGLVLNVSKGIIKACAVAAPGVGDYRLDALRDISAILGTELVSDMTESNFKNNINLEHLGKCKKAVITRKTTMFVNAESDQKRVSDAIDAINRKLEDPRLSDNEVKLYKQRRSKLLGGVAVLRVGGATQVEIQERRDRVDDALNATWAAAEEGIVPGGGVALSSVYWHLDEYINENEMPESIKAGFNVLKNACKMPISTICRNAGKTPEVIFEKLKTLGHNEGYNAREDKFCNMIDDGIIDPLKVTRLALENSVSAAHALISVGCAMVNDLEE